MGGPSNPIARIATAVGTIGASEVVRAGSSATQSLIKGENVGKNLKRDESMNLNDYDKFDVKKDVLGSSNVAAPTASTTLTSGAETLGAKAPVNPDDNIAPKVAQAAATAPPPDPESPKMPPAPDDATVNAPAYDAAKKTAQDEETRRLRSGAGRASTILTSGFGSTSTGSGRRYLGAG